MAKRIISFIILVILVISLSVFSASLEEKKEQIVLIPLDSRPCNTSYVKDYAQAMGKEIFWPEEGLDNYIHPSDSDKLYDFLYQSLSYADSYIIFTNQLINGGLINSRNPKSNLDLEKKVKELTLFLEKAKKSNKEISLLTVLPRHLPSQFTDLWNFKEELLAYSSLGIKEDSLPDEILDRYLSIYSNSDFIVKEMLSLSQEGLIDLLIIGQDDSAAPSISKSLLDQYREHEDDKIIIQPGADELTKLLLAKKAREEIIDDPGLEIIFIDDDLKEEVLLFEAYSSVHRLEHFLSFLDLKEERKSDNLIVIHNNPHKFAESLGLIEESQERAYLGLADIAYINKGDQNLFTNPQIISQINSYSGWNTVGNSLGTELANFLLYQQLSQNLGQLDEEEMASRLKAYYRVILTHYLDDFYYQAILRDQLIDYLAQKEENVSFLRRKDQADEKLDQLFKEGDWPELISREIKKSLPLDYEIKIGQSEIRLPWKRTFEAEIKTNISIELP